jgi:hypothetical protein
VPTLRELQRRFAAALFAEVYEPVGADIGANDCDERAGLAIYRDQLRAVFARTLALEYPVIERLVGEAYFRRLAGELQTAYPSRSGDLHHIGAPFAAFLKERFSGGPYDYLADVAALEWALQECTIAPEAPALDPHALRSVDPARYADLHFDFHPACRLMGSRYPVLDIWRANQTGAVANDFIDLAGGATWLLAHRSDRVVAFHVLAAPEFVFLEKLSQDLDLGTALEAAQKMAAAFDPGPALRRCVALQAFTAARLHQISSNRTS